MNMAVVDDEEAIREQIGGFIEKRNPDFDISSFNTGEGLLASGKDFDIIFLDIQMEGMGGIEAARTLRQSGVDAVVIFITGIREYVFEAFDVSAFHYLLKPIEEQKFMEVLGYQPCGVVVHEDGSVTYIGGCGDSPERVAEVNAINKAKREKEAAQRKASMERSQEAAEERKQQMEIAYRKQAVAEFFASRTVDMSRVTYTETPGVMGSAVAAYEQNIMETAGIMK